MLLLGLCLLSFAVASAQRTKRVTGAYTYYAPANVSLEEARRIALDRAKVAAIEETFGSLVTQSNSTLLNNVNGHTDSRFLSLGGSEVRGEWIETTKEPSFDISYQQEMLIVSVELQGIVRELSQSQVPISATILRNGTDAKFESDIFCNGDDMYLLFSAPTDGYLAAYMYDETSQRVTCMLPYIENKTGYQKIKGGEEYLFFKQEGIGDVVDEYTMTISGEIPESNTMYLLFSCQPIYMIGKNITTDDTGMRTVSYQDFVRWLASVRKNSTVSVLEKTITIKQKNT